MELIIKNNIILFDDEDFDLLKIRSWCVFASTRTFYAQASIKNKNVYMHRYLLNALPGQEIDHINGNGLDNRRENLRICNRRENCMNVSKAKNKSSIYKGVSWRTRQKGWRASIASNYRYYELGVFKSEIDAALAYNEKAKELFGEFAKLNIIC